MSGVYSRHLATNAARDRLIAEHVDVARRIALRVARRVPPWLSEDDLVAAAMVGLAEAADRYDDGREEPFVAFAEKRIRGAVLDELRRGDLLPRRTRVRARQVGQVIQSLQQRFGREPEDEEVAAELGVSVEEYRDDLEQLTHVEIVDLSPKVERNLGDDGEAAPDGIVERRLMVARLRECLDELPKRDAQVMALYYVEELSYSEIGQVLGVSESRVWQLHARAIVRLRTAMESKG